MPIAKPLASPNAVNYTNTVDALSATRLELTTLINIVNRIASANGALLANTISEYTSEYGVNVDSVVLKDGNIITLPTAAAINATATATAAELLTGVITSTSAAAVALQLPTVTNINTALALAGIVPVRGTVLNFIVDNSAGANTVTVGINTGITVASAYVITGGGTLTVSTANAVGSFSLVYITTTTAKIFRNF